ncbi:MAG: gamma-glutamylcyclotransferase family protein [Chitinophagaceae bacterium]
MASQTIYPLFVYGSLRSGFRSPAYEYISRYFSLVGDAKARGLLYDMGEYPAAVPSDEEAFITGELYAIRNETEFSWALGQLDDYEGVTTEPGEEQLYRRELCTVLAGGQPVQAWIYWYSGNTGGHPRIASGDVLDYLSKK